MELAKKKDSSGNGALVSRAVSVYSPETCVLVETNESATAGVTVTKSMFGRAIEIERPGMTEKRYFDAYGRVFYTERNERDVDWTGRNDAGDVEEYDTFWNGNAVHATFYGYDSFGNCIAETNAIGGATWREFDPDGRLLASGGATHPVRCAYDAQGRRTRLSTTRDGSSWDATAWAYDFATGLCANKMYADGSQVLYSHSPDGKPLRETKPSGAWKEDVYDALGRVAGVVSSDGALDAAMTRDEFGNVTSESNAVSFATCSLDARGNSTNEVQAVDGVSASFIRGFDSYGRLIRFARVGGECVGIGYAAVDGALAVVSNTSVNATYAFTSDRLDAGYALTPSNGVAFTRSLARGAYRRHLATGVSGSAGGVPVEGLAYSYDALGRPTGRHHIMKGEQGL